MRKSEPLLDGVVESTQPLERTLKLRELQTSYVYTTVLAKKCRVSIWLSTLCYPCITLYLPRACLYLSANKQQQKRQVMCACMTGWG